MSDPQRTSATIGSEAHSAGEPDPVHDDDGGSDVGGPAATTESGTEHALTGDSSVDREERPDDQAKNPL